MVAGNGGNTAKQCKLIFDCGKSLFDGMMNHRLAVWKCSEEHGTRLIPNSEFWLMEIISIDFT